MTQPPEPESVYSLLNRLDAALTEALQLRDERAAQIRKFNETGIKTDADTFNRVQKRINLCAERITAIQAALAILRAPNTPLDASRHGKVYSVATYLQLAGFQHLSPEDMAELNARATALEAERKRELQRKSFHRDGAQ